MNKPDFEQLIQMGMWDSNRPSMYPADCRMLWDAIHKIKAKTIVEIGAFKGVSSMVMGLAALNTGGHVWSVEVRPQNDWYINIQKKKLRRTVTIVRGCSPAVKIDLPCEIDLLFIDGDHQTRSALRDYYYWNHFVRVGGVVGFHDIYGPPSAKVNKAISMILDDDSNCLKEISRCLPQKEAGIVLFEKVKK